MPDIVLLRFIGEESYREQAKKITEYLLNRYNNSLTVYDMNRKEEEYKFILENEIVVALLEECTIHIAYPALQNLSNKIIVYLLEELTTSRLHFLKAIEVYSKNVQIIDTKDYRKFHKIINGISDKCFAECGMARDSKDLVERQRNVEKTASSAVYCTKSTKSLNKDELIGVIKVLDLRGKIERAENILIKPNLAAGKHYFSGSGVVTDKNDLQTVIESLLSFNNSCDIYIIESDSIGQCYGYEKFKFQSYEFLSDRFKQVSLLDLTRAEQCYVQLNGLFFGRAKIPKVILTADFFVSLAKIKTHNLTKITGILKNQLGCLPTSEKKYYHPYLDRVIPDINSIIQPDLCILDGNPGIEGDPVHGIPKHLDLTLIGNDPVATDSIMARIIGIKPENVAHLMNAYNEGLGNIHLENITSNVSLDEYSVDFQVDFRLREMFFLNLGLYLQKKGFINFGHDIHNCSKVEDAATLLYRMSAYRIKGTRLEKPTKCVHNFIWNRNKNKSN